MLIGSIPGLVLYKGGKKGARAPQLAINENAWVNMKKQNTGSSKNYPDVNLSLSSLF